MDHLWWLGRTNYVRGWLFDYSSHVLSNGGIGIHCSTTDVVHPSTVHGITLRVTGMGTRNTRKTTIRWQIWKGNHVPILGLKDISSQHHIWCLRSRLQWVSGIMFTGTGYGYGCSLCNHFSGTLSGYCRGNRIATWYRLRETWNLVVAILWTWYIVCSRCMECIVW